MDFGPDSFKIIGISESHMQASTIILTNQYDASTIQMPNVANVKLELDDNIVCVLSDSDDNICICVLCIMLAYFISTPHLLRCQGLAFILVCMITLYPMVYAVNH